MRKAPICACLPLWAALHGLGWAQSVPDAGTLRQQLERDRQAPLPQRARPLIAPDAPPLKLPKGEQITVRRFHFEGHTLLANERLQALVARWLGRPIAFDELAQAAQAVAALYRDEGWVAHAYLPQQDVTEGEITVRVVEARFAGLRFDGETAQRVPAGQVARIVNAAVAKGQPMNGRRIDRGLLLADDLPGVSVAAALEPGDKDGETRIALRMSVEPVLVGELSVDNGGSRSTGTARTTATASINNPWGEGEQIRLQAVASEGSLYGRMAADLPVGAHGTRVGFSLSALNYRVVQASLASLQSKGQSNTLGLELSHPVLRSRLHNLYFNGQLEQRSYVNEAQGAVQTRYRSNSLVLGLNGNLFDDHGGGGANNGSLNLHVGRLHPGVREPGEAAMREGGYSKLRAAISRRQTLNGEWALVGSWRGQYAARDLDSSERFYLGGPEGVRAYPASEAGGSRGQLASLELRWQPKGDWSAAAFGDGGRVESNAAGSGRAALYGIGASVAWQGPQGLSARLTWARRLGENPNPTATGADQDGSLVRDRLWLQGSLPF